MVLNLAVEACGGQLCPSKEKAGIGFLGSTLQFQEGPHLLHSVFDALERFEL